MSEPDPDIHISIIDTQTAKTSEGFPVNFRPVKVLLQTHAIDLRSPGEGFVRTYADHWVAISPVVLGTGSWNAESENLIRNGLYELYPHIEAANERKDPRPHLTTQDLRKYFFRSDVSVEPITRETLDAAERVGMCFEACKVNDDTITETGRVAVSEAVSSWLSSSRCESEI